MKKLLVCAVGVAVITGFGWLFPLFHIVPLRQAQQRQQQAVFDAAGFARDFWDKKLLASIDRAVPLGDLLAALAQDPGDARKRFGRSPGLSASCYFFIKGSARVIGINRDSIRVEVEDAPAGTAAELSSGLLFGNAVRDGSGLLNVSEFPNSQDFNDLSTELNRLVETRVLPGLRERAAVGKAVRFAGCVELEEGAVPSPLQIIPVKIDWP